MEESFVCRQSATQKLDADDDKALVTQFLDDFEGGRC